jgi:predicted transcriptional regulator
VELSEIKRIRKKNNLTQTELARQAGVSQSLIAKVESGQLDPTYTKAKKIFEALENIDKSAQKKAIDLMIQAIISVASCDKVQNAISKMKKNGISQLPVVDDEKVVGIISESTIVDALSQGKNIMDLPVSQIMEDAPPSIPEDTPADVILNLLKHYSIVLVTQKGKLRGVITKADMMLKMYG